MGALSAAPGRRATACVACAAHHTSGHVEQGAAAADPTERTARTTCSAQRSMHSTAQHSAPMITVLSSEALLPEPRELKITGTSVAWVEIGIGQGLSGEHASRRVGVGPESMAWLGSAAQRSIALIQRSTAQAETYRT